MRNPEGVCRERQSNEGNNPDIGSGRDPAAWSYSVQHNIPVCLIAEAEKRVTWWCSEYDWGDKVQ